MKTSHGEMALSVSLVIQLSQVYSQACCHKKYKVEVKSFSEASVRDMHDNVIAIFRHKPEYIILQVGTNNALNLPPNEIQDKKLNLKNENLKIKITNKDCKVIILTLTYRLDNRKPGNNVYESTTMLVSLNFCYKQ